MPCMKVKIYFISAAAALLAIVALVFILRYNAAYYCQRASKELAKGDTDNALADYDKAIKLKPDYFAAYIGRGSGKYKKSDPRGALADYNKAIGLNPDLNHAPDLAQTPEAIVTNEIAMQSLALFEAKDYDKLDALAANLRSSKERYADGVWKLTCAYDGLVPSNGSSDEEWETRLSDIGRWAVAKPDSITPQVAWANVLVAYAWKARGAGYTVSSEGSQLFGQRLIEAIKILNEAKTKKEQCPMYWRVLMRAALGAQLDKVRFNTIFNEAIKAEPDCEGYYYRRVVYLLPRWYGSEGEWQNDLTVSADKIGGENGDMLYAQVIWNMNQPAYFENPFREDSVSWTRVDKGFAVIEDKFPDSLAAKIERARLAVLFNNAQAATNYNRGCVEDEKGDLDGALADYNKAIEINPDYVLAYNNRGNVKKEKGDWNGALADYNKAIEIEPNHVLAYYGRGAVKSEKNDWGGALADYDKAIELKPDFAEAYFTRGAVKQAKHDFAGALADFTKAIELKPAFAQAYVARGNLEKYKGDANGAQADFKKATELNPKNARTN